MSETTFESAKVGDWVWSSTQGWGSVIDNHDGTTYPIRVSFNNGNIITTFTTNGMRVESDKYPTLFWDEVKITAPSKPKRMVKRVVEGWVNIYPNNHNSSTLFKTKEIAVNARSRYALGDPFFIHHEYETEE